MLKIIFEVKIYKNIRISDTKPNSVSTSTWLCATSNMKKSSHKTWQTSRFVSKPLRIQTLREKSGGDTSYHVPSSKKVGGTRPPCPPPNCAHAWDSYFPKTLLLAQRRLIVCAYFLLVNLSTCCKYHGMNLHANFKEHCKWPKK